MVCLFGFCCLCCFVKKKWLEIPRAKVATIFYKITFLSRSLHRHSIPKRERGFQRVTRTPNTVRVFVSFTRLMFRACLGVLDPSFASKKQTKTKGYLVDLYPSP